MPDYRDAKDLETQFAHAFKKAPRAKIVKTSYCSGPCGKKKKLPLGVSEKCADCGGQYL